MRNQSCSPGDPLKKTTKQNSPLISPKQEWKKALQPTSAPFLVLMQKSPWSALVKQQPNSSLPGKNLSQGQPHAFINRRKRKQIKIRLKNCFFLIRQRFRRRTQQHCGFLPGNEDVPCSKRCSCKSRERNSTHFCCRVCCGGERGLCHSYTFAEAQNTCQENSLSRKYRSPTGSTCMSLFLLRHFSRSLANFFRQAQVHSCPGCFSWGTVRV